MCMPKGAKTPQPRGRMLSQFAPPTQGDSCVAAAAAAAVADPTSHLLRLLRHPGGLIKQHAVVLSVCGKLL